jgi:UDP-N-acetylglucosamine 2-epimerase (non-hydrolysing)
MKPVAVALAELGASPTLVFTGQHPKLEPSAFGLEAFDSINLGHAGREDPHAHVGAVTKALLPLLVANPPELLVVQGDTSSALGAALGAATAGVPVAHVEAGLRTHDPALPWPEEEYRTAIDARADLLFAPTEVSAENLRAERVQGEIFVTGNTGVDAVLEAEARLGPRMLREAGGFRILVTCHRRESWGDGLAAIGGAIKEIAAQGGANFEVVLHPNSFVAESMRACLGQADGVSLLPPCGHDELLRRMRDCDLVLSDSGGIQEEAPALGIPLLVLREKTERPEGIAAGASRLVGTDRARIIREVRALLENPAARAAMSRRVFPFGDGNAGRRIGAIVVEWLERRSLTRRIA